MLEVTNKNNKVIIDVIKRKNVIHLEIENRHNKVHKKIAKGLFQYLKTRNKKMH
jgi:uncharacterized protein YuzE